MGRLIDQSPHSFNCLSLSGCERCNHGMWIVLNDGVNPSANLPTTENDPAVLERKF